MPEDQVVPASDTTIIKFEGDSLEFPMVIDGDKLALLSDAVIARAYRFAKLTTEFRIPLFHELVRRGRAGNILLVKYFNDLGLKYDTEYRFVKREEEARLLEAAELHAELNPAPIPDLALPAEAGDEKACEREEIEVSEPAPKPEKKPCHMCGVRKERIEKLEKEIIDLKQEKKDLKAMNKSLRESLDTLQKERKEVKKASVKKQDAADLIPRYRKDTLATGEFAVMQFVGTHDREAWESIEINKDEKVIEARLIQLIEKAAAKAKSATA
jgi:hypothetical protein